MFLKKYSDMEKFSYHPALLYLLILFTILFVFTLTVTECCLLKLAYPQVHHHSQIGQVVSWGKK